MHDKYQTVQGFVYNILTLLICVCVIYSFCSHSGSLVGMCVGVSKFMQQHLMAVASADSSRGKKRIIYIHAYIHTHTCVYIYTVYAPICADTYRYIYSCTGKSETQS